MTLNELKSEFERKKIALEFAEEARKPKSIIQLLYKELKQLQFQIVNEQSREKLKRDFDPV